MNDVEIAKIMPEWALWPKSKIDAVFHEYQLWCFNDSNHAEELKLQKRASQIQKQRFLKLLPQKLDARDPISIMALMTDNWEPVFDGDDDPNDIDCSEEAQLSLALDVWDSAGIAIMNALDSRDGILAFHITTLLSNLTRLSGRVVSKLRKCPKFIPWLVFELQDGVEFVDSPVIQFSVYNIIQFVILGSNKKFLDQLIDAKIPSTLFLKLRKVCPSALAPLARALECFVYTAHKHYSLDNRAVRIILEVGNRLTCQRIMETDMNQQRLRGKMQAETWTDIGDVAEPLAHLAIALALVFRIPTPTDVRNHLGIFGQGYTDREPTNNLVERERWSKRYFCLRVRQVDFASDSGQAEGKELLRTIHMKYSAIENARNITLRCSNCHKLETDNEDNGDQRDGNKNDNQNQCISLSTCSNCRRVYYCSRECQASHWKTQHKQACKKPDKNSVPEKYLTIDESVEQAHGKATAGGSCLFPVLFVLWLTEWKFPHCSSSSSTVR